MLGGLCACERVFVCACRGVWGHCHCACRRCVGAYACVCLFICTRVRLALGNTVIDFGQCFTEMNTFLHTSVYPLTPMPLTYMNAPRRAMCAHTPPHPSSNTLCASSNALAARCTHMCTSLFVICPVLACIQPCLGKAL